MLLVFEATPGHVRAYSKLCIPYSLLVVLKGPYEVLHIEFRLFTGKESILPTVEHRPEISFRCSLNFGKWMEVHPKREHGRATLGDCQPIMKVN